MTDQQAVDSIRAALVAHGFSNDGGVVWTRPRDDSRVFLLSNEVGDAMSVAELDDGVYLVVGDKVVPCVIAGSFSDQMPAAATLALELASWANLHHEGCK